MIRDMVKKDYLKICKWYDFCGIEVGYNWIPIAFYYHSQNVEIAQSRKQLLILPQVLEYKGHVIPLSVCETSDRGTIYTLFEETNMPRETDIQLNALDKIKDDSFPFNIIDGGRGEYVVHTDKGSFENHLKDLGQVGRAWNKNKDIEVVEEFTVTRENAYDLFYSNRSHFLSKEYELGEGDTLIVPADHIDVVGTYHMEVPYTKIVGFLCKGDIIGLAYYQVDKDRNEVHWLNSVLFRNDAIKKRAFGNFILLNQLKDCYDGPEKGMNLNLGLDVFDYKTAWKPVHTTRRGLEWKTQ